MFRNLSRCMHAVFAVFVLVINIYVLTGCSKDGFFSDRYLDTDYTPQSARERDEEAVKKNKPTIAQQIQKVNREELRQEIIQRIRARLAERRAQRQKNQGIQTSTPPATVRTEANLTSVLQQNANRRKQAKDLMTPTTIQFNEDLNAYQPRLIKAVKEQLEQYPQTEFILDAIAPQTPHREQNLMNHKKAVGKIKEIADLIRKHTAVKQSQISYTIINSDENAETITLKINP